MAHDSTTAPRLQDPKFDWREHKMQTYKLSKLYELAGYEQRSKRVAYCSTYPIIGITQGGKRRLVRSNFCGDRLCPICTTFAARKQAQALSRILDKVEADHPGVRYIFLTLTVRNVEGLALNKSLKDLTAAWHKLINHKAFDRAIHGWFRALEITRNRKDGTYHPHIHAVMAVEPEYFVRGSGLYLSHDWYKDHWAKACGVAYKPSVRIQRTKASAQAVADAKSRGKSAEYAAAMEASKYPIKTADYITTKLPQAVAASVVAEYAAAVKGRRFTALGGWLKAAAQALELEDAPRMDDLADIHDQPLRDDIIVLVEHYKWCFGAKDYILEDIEDAPDIIALRGCDADAGDAAADPQEQSECAADVLDASAQLELVDMPPLVYQRPN